MKKIKLMPLDFPCELVHAPAGFFLFDDEVCLKSRYSEHYASDGRIFWGGAKSIEEREKLIVTPLFVEVLNGEDAIE